MRTPCQLKDPEMWVGDNADEREEAAHLCGTCPIKRECWLKALENAEEWGVWGGVDMAPGNQRKTPRRPCVVCGTLMPRRNGHPRSSCDGCTETKSCAQCGNTFPRTYQSANQWEKSKFCGHRCSGLSAGKESAA